MNQSIAVIIDQLRQELPAIFAGPASDELTGGAIHWRTVQNQRSLRQIPDNCFIRSGRRVLVRRDEFLAWWSTTLSEARQPFGKPARATPPTPMAGKIDKFIADRAAARDDQGVPSRPDAIIAGPAALLAAPQ
jgi:hypothetical protein